MLEQVADDVFVFTSECLESNTVIVQGDSGVLLIDPGLTTTELEQLAAEIPGPVVAAFSTHPHWDHVLWHPALGDAPRYGTERNASSVTMHTLRGTPRSSSWNAACSSPATC